MADAGLSATRFIFCLRRALAFAALAFACALTGSAAAQDSDTVTLNFVNADIEAVVKAVAEITGRNFVVDPRVKGTVNIVSARPVARALVYPTLLSALRMQGYAAVEADGVVKIVPEADAKTQAGPVQRGNVSASGERIVTQVIALRHESAPVFVKACTEFRDTLAQQPVLILRTAAVVVRSEAVPMPEAFVLELTLVSAIHLPSIVRPLELQQAGSESGDDREHGGNQLPPDEWMTGRGSDDAAPPCGVGGHREGSGPPRPLPEGHRQAETIREGGPDDVCRRTSAGGDRPQNQIAASGS